MSKLLRTSDSTALFVLRIILAVIVFPHGAQKLLGWFGGYGFKGTMGFLTGMMHLPYFIGLLVICIEFFGSLLLIFGALTRVAALGIIGLFAGIVYTSHIQNGFFMNWSGKNAGEGYEFHLLVMGTALALLIGGAGRWSVDRAISKP
jgi:putative oxidoreductase